MNDSMRYATTLKPIASILESYSSFYVEHRISGTISVTPENLSLIKKKNIILKQTSIK